MNNLFLAAFVMVSSLVYSQTEKNTYLLDAGIIKDSVNTLTFKSETEFQSFVQVFEEKKGFRPQWLIIDSSGKLLKHKLDQYIKECGKGDVDNIKKKYHKKSPNIHELNALFNQGLKKPTKGHYIIVFMWMKGLGVYNQHTFETYHVWKENPNIKIYFLDLKPE